MHKVFSYSPLTKNYITENDENQLTEKNYLSILSYKINRYL